MLELAVLGLLSEQPLHGYELKKRLSETLGPLWGISFGSLYPALRRLERSGAIRGRRAGRRPARRIRRRPGRSRAISPRRARGCRPRSELAHPQGVPRSPPAGEQLFVELLDRRGRRRRTHLRVEALVLPSPRAPRHASRSSNAGARSSPNGWPSRAQARDAHHRSLHPVAPRAPDPVHPARSRVDRGADRARARRNSSATAPKEQPHEYFTPNHPAKKVRVAIAGSRQLREQPRAGRRVLPERRPGRARARV